MFGSFTQALSRAFSQKKKKTMKSKKQNRIFMGNNHTNRNNFQRNHTSKK